MKPGDAHLYDVGAVHSPKRDGLTKLVRIEERQSRPHQAFEHQAGGGGEGRGGVALGARHRGGVNSALSGAIFDLLRRSSKVARFDSG